MTRVYIWTVDMIGNGRCSLISVAIARSYSGYTVCGNSTSWINCVLQFMSKRIVMSRIIVGIIYVTSFRHAICVHLPSIYVAGTSITITIVVACVG